MFRKLMKHDMAATFKMWWIAAVSSLVFSLTIRTAIEYGEGSDISESAAINLLVILAALVSYLGLMLFLFVGTFLPYVVFYKNFFTDEGYLTFTLPVKKHELLNSKLITACLAMLATLAVFVLDTVFIVIPFDAWEIEKLNFSNIHFAGTKEMALFVALVIELLLIIIISFVAAVLLMFMCITVAAIFSKKHKIIAAVILCYFANIISSSVVFFVSFFSIGYVSGFIEGIQKTAPVFSMIMPLLIVLGESLLVCIFLYLAVYRLLDRKLDLQ